MKDSLVCYLLVQTLLIVGLVAGVLHHTDSSSPHRTHHRLCANV